MRHAQSVATSGQSPSARQLLDRAQGKIQVFCRLRPALDDEWQSEGVALSIPNPRKVRNLGKMGAGRHRARHLLRMHCRW